MANSVNTTLKNIADAIRYKLETDELISPIDFPSKISEIPVAVGGFDDPTPIITGTVRLVSNSASFIRAYAFYDCSQLAAVSFPNCTSINNGVFANCSALKTVNFATCTSIGSSAFYQCSNLSTFSFPNCEYIGNSAFYNCSKLSNIDLPNCSFIGNNAFTNCYNISSINLPNVKVLGGAAFCACRNITGPVSLPVISSLYDSVFYDCRNITSVYLPELTSLYGSVFENCSQLSSFYLPKIKTIYGNAFYNTALTGSIELSTLEGIGSSVFGKTSITNFSAQNCSRIENGNSPFPSSILSIYMPNLTKIYGCGFQNCSNLQTLDIPYSKIDYINAYAFANTPFSTLTLTGISSILYGTFIDCSNLVSIYVPYAVNIDAWSGYSQAGIFANCYNLTTINNPQNIVNFRDIKWDTFKNCSALTHITLTEASKIYTGAFAGCKNLHTLILLGDSLFNSYPANAFTDTPILTSSYLGTYGSIYVPAVYLSSYKANWPEVSERIVALDSSDYIAPFEFAESNISEIPLSKLNAYYIGKNAFVSCNNLESVTLSNCLAMAVDAFEYCSQLVSVNLPNCLTINKNYTDMNCFSGCENLKIINLPKVKRLDNTNFPSSLESINLANCSDITGYDTFSGCNISMIDLPECVNVGPATFSGCSLLTSANLPKVKYISNNCFISCTNLTEVTIGPATSVIGYCAFQGCTNLSSFNFSQIQVIEGSAFADCSNLSGTLHLENVSSFGLYAFRNCQNISSVILSFDKITTFGQGVFNGCSNIMSSFIGGNYICDSLGNPVWYQGPYSTDITTLAFPNTYRLGIFGNQLGNCWSIQTIVFPSTITSIPAEFYCSRTIQLDNHQYPLNTVYILGNPFIGNDAFMYKTHLSSVYILGSEMASFGGRGWGDYTLINGWSGWGSRSASGKIYVRASLADAYRNQVASLSSLKNATIEGLSDEEIDNLLIELNQTYPNVI